MAAISNRIARVEPMKRTDHGFIGVIHVPPMPGDPRYTGRGDFNAIETAALRDAEALVEGGIGGIIIENFGSAPFAKGTGPDRIPPHQIAMLTRIARSVSERFRTLPVGINCLRNDALSAIGIAAAVGLDFIRVNIHTGAYLTDQGVIEGEAHRTLRYRQQLAADRVAILADVLVKHATPLAPLDVEQAVADAFSRGLADGIIVTGSGTGEPISLDELKRVRAAAGDGPVFLGSGLTPANAPTLAPYAHGAIVGTWLKEKGDIRRPVDPARVRELAAILNARLRQNT